MSEPSVKLTSIQSIKKELIEKKEEQTPELEKIVFEPIEHFAFQQVWKSYLEKLIAEKKTFILKMLEVFTPEIRDNHIIVLGVGNDAHVHALMQERDTMVYFLKKELDKKAIDFRIEVDKSKNKNEILRKPYTAKEKFEFLLTKNPKMQDLKDRLKLELDY